ncbi:MAG: hypothetical protein LW742_01550 [Sphingomonadales bacterium]|nr:hypothetical protein [Sphingomonadales bacterium]
MPSAKKLGLTTILLLFLHGCVSAPPVPSARPVIKPAPAITTPPQTKPQPEAVRPDSRGAAD